MNQLDDFNTKTLLIIAVFLILRCAKTALLENAFQNKKSLKTVKK